MGTHPIFESDFDCLTEVGLEKVRSMSSDSWTPVKREVFLIFMLFMSTTMAALAIFFIVRYICGSISHAEQNTKKSEKENEHIRQIQALKLTALQEKTKHLTQIKGLNEFSMPIQLMIQLLLCSESGDKKGIPALVESLGAETSTQHIEAILIKSSELHDMIKTILYDEQNNFIHQNYANRSLLIIPTDEDSINE